jgi:5,5'-dehydrodivanillate O-demethylase
MLSVEDNRRLTEIGPGTPMGALMRRYWHPIAARAELDQDPVRPVRLLGEDLVLYRDRSGRLGLVSDSQREAALASGLVVHGDPTAYEAR